MPDSKYSWDTRASRYRGPDGRFVPKSEVLKARDSFVERSIPAIDGLSNSLSSRSLSLSEWQVAMRREIKDAFIGEYLLGRGGQNAMTQRDWGIVGRALRDQYAFLRGFAEDVASGEMSPAQVRIRARMYAEASTWAYERARAEAHGLPNLPQYPADGNTRCLANCACHLEYEEQETSWDVYWLLGVAEHCVDCIGLNSSWDPLTVEKR